MAEIAQAVLYRTVNRRLTQSTTELWGMRVFPDLAKTGTARPYVVYSYAGGGEINGLRKQDAEIVLIVKAIAESMGQAFVAAGRISTLLNDADYSSVNVMDGGSEWAILHVKQEQIVHLIETVDGVQIYHAGHRFRFRMERA